MGRRRTMGQIVGVVRWLGCCTAGRTGRTWAALVLCTDRGSVDTWVWRGGEGEGMFLHTKNLAASTPMTLGPPCAEQRCAGPK
ncbi:hypothetical protein QBC39DRAFT_366311 [Podospora conica]|nr:hypothetical protein QBC39DRAFT_366311 [Schizothecium conicum]